MKISEDVRQYSSKQGTYGRLSTEDGIKKKSKEFNEAGAEI
ncbi:MAG: hypothetical protein ACSHX7_02855 [Luteolibacter sp.]